MGKHEILTLIQRLELIYTLITSVMEPGPALETCKKALLEQLAVASDEASKLGRDAFIYHKDCAAEYRKLLNELQ